MTDRPRTTGDDGSQDTTADGFRRREFVALGAGVGATMLAGCAGDGGLTSSDGSDGSQTLSGNFRLLISDAPADIDDFDQLNVTLDRARIFEARDEEEDGEDDEEEDDDAEEADQTGNETDTESDSPNGTADEEDDADEDDADVEDGEDADEEDGEDADEDEEDEDDEEDRGFTVVDLDGETVDLTRVIGDDATTVFDDEIPAGSYEKIELEVSAVEGIVDGEAVDVKLPSEKLQITNEFEVTPDEPVSFVFDINVVKRGPNNGYILKPVISGSGVAGRDVDVNEIDDDDDDEDDSDEDDSGEDADETEDGGDDSDGEEDADDTTSGNETDDAGNETAA